MCSCTGTCMISFALKRVDHTLYLQVYYTTACVLCICFSTIFLLFKTSWQIQQTVVIPSAIYIHCCLPAAPPLHPCYLDKGVFQKNLAFISFVTEKIARTTSSSLKNYVHALTLRLPEPVWIGSLLETTGFQRKFINGPKSQQFT